MPTLYALPDAAKALGGISVWTLRKHISDRRIRVVRIGRRVFLDAEELERIRRKGLPSLRIEARNARRGQEMLRRPDRLHGPAEDRLVTQPGRDEVR
jgi:hypothetical protein